MIRTSIAPKETIGQQDPKCNPSIRMVAMGECHGILAASRVRRLQAFELCAALQSTAAEEASFGQERERKPITKPAMCQLINKSTLLIPKTIGNRKGDCA